MYASTLNLKENLGSMKQPQEDQRLKFYVHHKLSEGHPDHPNAFHKIATQASSTPSFWPREGRRALEIQ